VQEPVELLPFLWTLAGRLGRASATS
jgi:hypothetical protein